MLTLTGRARAGRTRRTNARSRAAAGSRRSIPRSAKDWPSGGYRLDADGRRPRRRPIRYDHLIIVRPEPGRKPGRILHVAATGTWTAYNTWGGSNHYQGITGPNRDQFATTVSIAAAVVPRLRQAAARGAARAAGDGAAAGRPGRAIRIWNGRMPPAIPRNTPRAAGRVTTGHFFRWAERSGYAVDLCSQHELHFEPELIRGYDCAVFIGHDEYWTWEMRDAVDAFVDGGGRAARFAANFMWQTRLEDEGRRQVCYKYRARAEDPAYQGRRHAARPIPGRRRRSVGRAR